MRPAETNQRLQERVTKTIADQFPIEGKKHRLDLDKVWVEDKLDMQDLPAQKRARLEGKSWTVPVKAEVTIRDRQTNKVVGKKKLTIAKLPQMTPRYGFIVDGKEYQVTNQFLLRPGVYNRIRQDGSLAGEFHLQGRPFDIRFDPETKKFTVKVGGAYPPLYPILKEIGVDDRQLEKLWGKEILAANQRGTSGKRAKAAAAQFYEKWTGQKTTPADAGKDILARFEGQQLDPAVTAVTLGRKYDRLTPQTLLDSTEKLLSISRGKAKPDNRESLVFKKFRGVDDIVADRLAEHARTLKWKILRNVDRTDDPGKVLPAGAFEAPIQGLFKNSQLSNYSDQTNVMDMLTGAMKTTVMGEGGIQSGHALVDELKLIDPSHFGFLDPLHTPEDSKTGVTLTLAEGVKPVKDNELATIAWDIKKKKAVAVTPSALADKVVVAPDQVRVKSLKDVKPAKAGKIDAMNMKTGEKVEVPWSKADYALLDTVQMFSPTTNLIPFLPSNVAVRATTGTRQITQAVSLKDREAPLVQAVGSGGSALVGASSEEHFGRLFSERAPAAGVVEKVGKNEIVIKTKGGKREKVSLYHHFPLNNGKGEVHSQPLVKPGDKVKSGQVIADTNYTRDGVLALGKNIKVAYLPFKGLTFEDGVVLSETGAKKLTSVHLHRKSADVGKEGKLSKKLFQGYYGNLLPKENADKLDDDGVIKPGARVKPGDVLVAGLRKAQPTTEAKMLQRLHRSLVKPYTNAAVVWDKDVEGVVTDVVKKGGKVQVLVHAEHPMVVGDKLTGRHGNKGVVTAVLPDQEMPRTADGEPIELLMNPMTVPGRINLGQVLETAASKVAEKTGKPYVVSNFSPDVSYYLDQVRKDLKKHGLSDKEPVFDPDTGKKLGEVQVGKQYILKLKHMVDTKASARAGGAGYAYDQDKIPKAGGPSGAKSIGNLGVYAMLSHGLRKNLQEMATWKMDMDQADQLWTAIQKGEAPPAPKSTFAYRKFVNLLRAAGVDTKKEGNTLVLRPMTDADIKKLAKGEIKDPGKMVLAKDPTKPEPGGLFDPKVTGGLDGSSWSYIHLHEPMPNPIFENATRAVLGLTKAKFEDLVSGKIGVDKDGKIVDDPQQAKYFGGEAVKRALDAVDVDKELRQVKKELPHLRRDELDRANRKYKYLRVLKQTGLSPSKAYMNSLLPVLPPKFRPLTVDKDGNIVRDDLNEMYKGVGLIASQMKSLKKLPPDQLVGLRKDLYDALRAYTGVGTHPQLQYKGVLNIIEGKTPKGAKLEGSPKTGFFQRKLIGARQDMTLYSTISPNPQLGLDEVGLPKALATRLMEPFTTQKLVKQHGISPLQARKMIRKNDPLAESALKQVLAERPVLLKRDPALHKYSVQAFKPVMVQGKRIQIHPLVTGGFNADFDGNCVLYSSKIVLTMPASYAKSILDNAKGGSNMLKGSSKVAWNDCGLRLELRIDEMPHSKEPETTDRNGNPVYSVDPAIKVLTYDHLTGEVYYAPILGLTIEEGSPTVVIKTRHHEVQVSANESLSLYDHETGRLVKSLAAEENVDRFVPVVSGYPLGDGLFGYELGWVFGAFVSDGWIDSARGNVHYTKASIDHRYRFKQALRSLNRDMKIKFRVDEDYHIFSDKQQIEGGSVKLHVYGLDEELLDWFRSCVSDSVDTDATQTRQALYKRLPPYYILFSEDALWGLLSGLIDGDGSIAKSSAGRYIVQYHTSSVTLKEDLENLATMLGIRVKATAYYPKPGRIQKSTAYVLNFSIVDIARKADKIHLTSEKYKELLDELKELYRQGKIKDDDDLVPVPTVLSSYLRSAKTSLLNQKKRNSLATMMSRHKTAPGFSRKTAQGILEAYRPYIDSGEGLPPDVLEAFKSWEVLVNNYNVRWERIKEVVPAGKETVYDLIVPDTKVFAVNGGMIVWDTMSAYVPVSSEAVREAWKALPSRNLFADATGEIMYTPTKEMLVGLYLATADKGKKVNKSFKTVDDAYNAAVRGDIRMDDQVVVAGKRTTPARARLEQTLPEPLRKKYGGKVWDKKVQKQIYRDLGKLDPTKYSDWINRIKDTANDYMYHTGFSLGLDDYATVEPIRNRGVAAITRATAKVKDEQKKLKVIDVGSERMYHQLQQYKEKHPDNLYRLTLSGVKPGPEQYRQIALAPMLLTRPDGSVSPTPVTRSYPEGLSLLDYWTATSGARKGIINKVQSIQEPGALMKQMVNSVLDRVVVDGDCQGSDGISVDVDKPDEYVNRVLAKPVRAGKHTIPAGTVVTPELVTTMRSNKVGKVVVHSPLKCVHGESGAICAKCYGVSPDGHMVEPGENVGVKAAHALGERAEQITLKAFHGGGVLPFGGTYKDTGLLSQMNTLKSLLTLPKNIPDAAPLARKTGKVKAIRPDPAGGWRVDIDGAEHYVPQRLGEPTLVPPESDKSEKKLKVGMEVRKGDALAKGMINPHQLLELRGLDTTQRYLTDSLYQIFKPHDIDKRHVEVIVGAMTDTGVVEDPGDVPGFVRGDKVRISTARYLNKKTKNKMKVRPELKGVSMVPFAQTEDWQALLNHQRLSQTLVEAAQQGWKSQLSSYHPIPGLVRGTDFGKDKVKY